MTNSTHAAVSVIGIDRPGIVTAVTRVLYELGANLEDATSTILSGHFAMMLIVSLPSGRTAETVERELAAVGKDMDLVVTVRRVEEAHLEVPEPSHVISVYGGDRPGIVYRVAEHLSSRDVNITDLSSRVIGAEDHPVYALMLEVAGTGGALSAEELEGGLAGLRDELGVEITVNAIDSDVL